MLLYVIYNAPLLRVANPASPNECIVGFVDDTTLLARGKNFKEAHATLKDMMERTNGVFEWSSTFNSPLEMNKLALVNFTQSAAKARDATCLTLMQPDHGIIHKRDIEVSPSAKLLSVILDARLNWSAQHERVRERAIKWTAAFKRFTRPVTGIRMKEARKLYNAVALPRICYAADIWFSPTRTTRASTHHAGPIGVTKRLEAIQRQAAISITGAMKTAPGDATIVHANLTPIGIQLKETGMRAYLRLASRPNHHPITKHTTRTRARQVKKHRTALHHLADITGINPSRLEKIGTQRYRPGDKTPITVKIAGTKELSIAWDNEHCNRGVVIYTDGSGLQGTISAAAILFINGIRTDELRYQLGSDKQHTVFEGELVAILLGLHLARRHIETHPSFSISVDNQAAIKSISNNRAQPAQYIIDEVKLAIRELIATGQEGNRNNRFINTAVSITLTWVAGHMGSKGNEAADELARAATEFGSSDNGLLPDLLRNDLPSSVSATKQYIKLNTKRDTIKWWKRSERYKKIKAIDC